VTNRLQPFGEVIRRVVEATARGAMQAKSLLTVAVFLSAKASTPNNREYAQIKKF